MMKLLVALASPGVSALATASPPACPKNSSCVVLRDGTVSSGAGASAIAIAGAQVTIYQARGGSPRALAAATSDGDGKFSIGLPAEGDDGIRYAVARKGKSIELAAVIGTATPPAITINEMTTVAAGYAMARFFRKGEIVGKSLPLQVAAGAPSLVYAVDRKGKTIGGFAGGGILGPWGVGVDSEDNVWVANFGPDESLHS